MLPDDINYIAVLKITRAHGIHGALVVFPYSDSACLYQQFFCRDGRKLTLSKTIHIGQKKVLMFHGINSRTDAEKLVGQELFVEKSVIDLEQDEVLISDLVDQHISVQDSDISLKIIAIHNFGAGDIVELDDGSGNSFMVPFCEENFIGLQKPILLQQSYLTYKEMI